MKQKVMIKVSMPTAKCRIKAMKTVVSVSGVISAELHGPENDKIMVTGENIDSVTLTNLLRKKVGFAELISVTPITKDDNDKDNKELKNPCNQHHTRCNNIYWNEVRDHNQDACTIM